jgi:hypothetical protein
LKKGLHLLKPQLSFLEKEIDNISIPDVTEIKTDIATIKADIQSLDKDIAKLELGILSGLVS